MMPPEEPHQLMVIDDVTEPFKINKEYLSKSCTFQSIEKKENGFSLQNLPPKLDMSLGMHGINVWKIME